MIDPRAVIDPTARIGSDVTVGPFSVIGPDVVIGDSCHIGPHVVINGPCTMGRENRVFQFASVGEQPQDLKYDGEPTRLEIGDRNTIREYVTINRGTPHGIGVTRVGSNNLLMAYCHIAHDCEIADGIVFANGASLAGHVSVGEQAILGGFTMVHQFCRVGAHSFCGMGSAIAKDVLPFTRVSGHPAHPHGINAEGLRRRGYSAARIRAIRNHYRTIYRSGLRLEEALDQLDAADDDDARMLAEFIRAARRSILR